MLKARGKKILNWILFTILLAAGAAVIGIIYYIGQLDHRKRDLADYIRSNPGATAIVAYTFDEQGEPVEDGRAIFENADAPLVVASTMKLNVLAAYAVAVEQGELDPAEQVPVAEVERYFVPGTDGGAHAAGLASLGLAADAGGFARDQSARIALDDIARIMIHYSGNAETDYLMDRLGMEQIASVMAQAGMAHHTPLRSILGVTLAMFNHEAPLTDAGRRQALINKVTNGDLSELERLARLYLRDQSWRAAQIAFMQSDEFIASAGQMGWEGQSAASQLFPKGTAREYAQLMAKIASGQFISPQVSLRIQQKLESVPTDWPLRLLFHRRYGAKDGVTAGVLSLSSYAVPKFGPLTGQPRVVVILTNDLPYETWSTQLHAQGVYLLQADIARAMGVFNRLASAR